MAILIIGDSFCSDLHGWPEHLAGMLGVKLDCRGVSGSSLYHVYQQLKATPIQHYQAVVLIVSAHDRLHVEDGITLRPDVLENKNWPDRPELAPAGQAFYQHLYDDEYFKVLQLGLLRQILQMVSHHPRCLILTAFPGNDLLHDIIIPTIPLTDIFRQEVAEIRDMSLSQRQLAEIDDLYFVNHMSPSNNVLLARYVWDLLEDGSSDIKLADFQPGFPNMRDLAQAVQDRHPEGRDNPIRNLRFWW